MVSVTAAKWYCSLWVWLVYMEWPSLCMFPIQPQITPLHFAQPRQITVHPNLTEILFLHPPRGSVWKFSNGFIADGGMESAVKGPFWGTWKGFSALNGCIHMKLNVCFVTACNLGTVHTYRQKGMLVDTSVWTVFANAKYSNIVWENNEQGKHKWGINVYCCIIWYCETPAVHRPSSKPNNAGTQTLMSENMSYFTIVRGFCQMCGNM